MAKKKSREAATADKCGMQRAKMGDANMKMQFMRNENENCQITLLHATYNTHTERNENENRKCNQLIQWKFASAQRRLLKSCPPHVTNPIKTSSSSSFFEARRRVQSVRFPSAVCCATFLCHLPRFFFVLPLHGGKTINKMQPA